MSEQRVESPISLKNLREQYEVDFHKPANGKEYTAYLESLYQSIVSSEIELRAALSEAEERHRVEVDLLNAAIRGGTRLVESRDAELSSLRESREKELRTLIRYMYDTEIGSVPGVGEAYVEKRLAAFLSHQEDGPNSNRLE